jgi:pimeloyl-ACP methyl ester carboxylesterase
MAQRGMTRREVLKQGFLWGLGATAGGAVLAGCDCLPEIAWGPDVLRPVFYGHRDYTTADGAPGTLRVFYPSLDGAPDGAPIVECVGEFPLVVFMHGQCSEADHHLKWFRLGATLARCGYVVAMPSLSNAIYPWVDPHPDLTLGVDVLGWMRTGWEMSSRVMAEPNTAFVGHSYGGLLAGRLAIDQPSSAYVSLGGVWTEWPGMPPNPLPSLPCPSMFAWGTADANADASGLWGNIPDPKHQLRFVNGGHWDYLPAASTTCETSVAPCPLVEGLAADFTAVFISKYMPPEASALGASTIPDDLSVPAIVLTGDQTFYAGAHLTSFQLITTTPGCSVDIEWSTPAGTGTRSLP